MWNVSMFVQTLRLIHEDFLWASQIDQLPIYYLTHISEFTWDNEHIFWRSWIKPAPIHLSQAKVIFVQWMWIDFKMRHWNQDSMFRFLFYVFTDSSEIETRLIGDRPPWLRISHQWLIKLWLIQIELFSNNSYSKSQNIYKII